MTAAHKGLLFALLFTVWSAFGKQCDHYQFSGTVDRAALWQDLTYLASDQLQGRETQTVGAQLTRQFLVNRYQQIGLLPIANATSYELPFTLKRTFDDIQGVNVAGIVKGSSTPEQYIVVTAHYDHLGKTGSKVFNGADDNASGVAAMLALAEAVHHTPLQMSVLFLATDAEENGLFGAKAFLVDPPIEIAAIKYNLNLDMLAQNQGRNRLYISGARVYDQLHSVVEVAIANAGLCLVSGHRSSLRRKGLSQRTNWRRASDHAVFDKANIPFLYIGVSEHSYYHTENDTVDRIDPDFYLAAVESSLFVLRQLDRLP